jgi:hypothetical protein
MKRACALIGAILLIHPAARAEQRCPIEIKLLLSPTTTQIVTASLGFEKERAGQIYFFDTKALDLSAQGVIIRVRQGANSDLTVKIRSPRVGGQPGGASSPLPRFPCEIDRTPAGENISYAVGRTYKTGNVPDTGKEIYSLLSASQKQLLAATKTRIDWTRVVRIVDIVSTTWQVGANSASGKLALELWEWPAGRILELSAKTSSVAEQLRYAQIERLVKINELSLSEVQDNKTSLVLRTLVDRSSDPRY